MSKVVVIGSGHGGMAAAARLRVKGHDVTVYSTVKDRAVQSQPLTLLGAYRDLFLKTGNSLEDNIDLVEVGSALTLNLSNGDSLNIPPSGIGRTISAIEEHLGAAAGAQWRNYISELGQLWLKIRRPMIENRDLSATSILRNIGFPTIWKFRSLTKLQNRFLHHPDLIELANTYRAQLNCLPSADLGLLGINAYVQQNFGVYSPVGGWSKLTELLKVRCAQLGVSFELGQEVKPVELSGQICGVELAGKFKAADFVLLSKSEGLPENLSWLNLPDFITLKANLFVIEEQSWLGLGSAHAVLTGEILANHIGSAS